MMLEITSWIPNYLSSLPLHLQLAKTIRQKIQSDVLPGGFTLPTAAYTCVRLGVSAQIVKLAYAQLEDEKLGIVQDNGTFTVNVKTAFINANHLYAKKPIYQK